MTDPLRFIELSEVGGRDTAEAWHIYLEVLDGVYRRTLFNGGLVFRGLPVRCRRMPEDRNKHFAFWHLVQEGYPEQDRLPDVERCRRLLWVSWVIRSAGTDATIRIFPQAPRHGEKKPWVLWWQERDYAVILADRDEYFLLKTAFVVKHTAKREEFEREWQASRPVKKD